MKSLRASRFAALFVIAAAVAIGGSAGTGQAAPGMTFVFEPLIGTSDINQIPEVSYGRGIGFHLFVQNAGTNSTPQTSSVVVTSTSATYDTSQGGAAATFTNANGTVTVTCTVGSSSNQMVCQLPTGTLNPGDTFEAFFRFIAPSAPAASPVATTAALSVAAQTVGGKKNGNSGTTLSSATLYTNLVSDATIDNAYLRKSETATTGGQQNLSSTHPQNFTLTTPSGLLKGAFGVAVGIKDKVGTTTEPCAGLLSCTTLTVPAAHFFDDPTNPFYSLDPLTINPYTWEMNAKYTGGFMLHGVVHVDDNGNAETLFSCASLNNGGLPTALHPLCYDTLEQFTNTKKLHATGKGLENGNWGWN